ncbi:hypothetical protein KI387_025785, partial [Taxus chinensis]
MEGDFPLFISTQYAIEHLDLSNNRLSRYIPDWLWDVSYNMDFLDLSMNLFDGFIPVKIGQHLRLLSMAKTNLRGGIPHSIYEGNLEVLDLSNNKLSGKSFTIVGNFSSTLKVLNLENNCFEGEIRNMACLQTLKLTGDIPHEIGFLIGLRVLNLSGNQLNSEIPNSFKKILQLESLDLSRNNLIGAISTELQVLTFWSYLDVSHNNLSGRIPQG